MVRKKAKTDADYQELDEAIITISMWWDEICAELRKRQHPEQTLMAVRDAMEEVHSPDVSD